LKPLKSFSKTQTYSISADVHASLVAPDRAIDNSSGHDYAP